MEGLLDTLRQLEARGRALQAAEEADVQQLASGLAVDSRALNAARKLGEGAPAYSKFWDEVAGQRLALSDVSRALADIMWLAPEHQAMQAALLLTTLLKSPACPVFSLFDRRACGSFLKLMRGIAQGSAAVAGKPARGGGATSTVPMDVDGASESEGEEDTGEGGAGGIRRPGGKAAAHGSGMDAFAEAATNCAAVLASFSLKDQTDTVAQVAETFAEASRALRLPPAGAEACYAVLLALLAPIHGSMLELSAMVLRLLTPNLLGVAAKGANAAKAGTAMREHTLQLAKAALRRSPECADAVAALARHVVLRASDKAETRVAAVQSAVALMGMLGDDAQKQFVVFAARLSRTPKVSQRMMAVDLAPALLAAVDDPFAPIEVARPAPPPAAAATAPAGANAPAAAEPLAPSNTPATSQPGGTAAQQLVGAPWGTVCLAVLVQRCSDKAAGVRARALQNLAAVARDFTSFYGGASSEEARFLAALAGAHEVILQPQPLPMGCTPGGLISPPAVSPAGTSEPGDTPMTLGENTPFPTGARTATKGREGRRPTRATRGTCFTMPSLAVSSANLNAVISLARKRCFDEKGQVRKAGLQLLEALLVMRAAGVQHMLPSPAEMAVLEAATADSLVSVRKAGLAAVHSLLQAAPQEVALAGLWVRAVLPLVRDVEATLQELVLEQFHELVLSRTVTAAAVGKDGAPTSAAGKAMADLLPLLQAIGGGGTACRACMTRCIGQLKAKQRLKAKQAAAGLQRIVQQLHAAQTSTQQEATAATDTTTGAWMLYAEIAAADPAAPSWRFLQEQWEAMKDSGNSDAQAATAAFSASVSAGHILRAIALAAAKFPSQQAQQLSAQLMQALLTFSLAPSVAAAHVAALAELAQSNGSDCAGSLPRELLSAAEKILAAYVESFHAGRGGASMIAEAWQAAGALFTCGEVVLLRTARPSARLVLMVQALTSSKLASAPADAGDGSGGSSEDVPAMVQAHAWVTLGKMCLADEALAKKCVPMFVQELERASLTAVRNNIMVALADLVMHYTALVDAHVGRLAACIRDPHELVRTQALALLSNLLQKDYVKWRGPLFHRFLLALVDDAPAVAGLAQYMLADVLGSKMPNLAYNHFVEALFVLNDCHVGLHAGAAAAASMSDAAGATANAFCLRGSSSRMRAKRDAIYKAMLRRMTPEHKFATSARLCQEVLGGVADGGLPLSEPSCAEVLGDALRCLASKDIKVAASRTGADDGGDEDIAAAVGAAKGRLVSQMMKKHLVEGVVPVVIELKAQLEGARHPLLGELMAAMRVMLRDYKAEIEDILVADRQLAKELLYDMRQDELAAKAARAAAAADASTGGAAAGGETGARQISKTPRGPPGTAQRLLPAGTSSGTPMAAEVLQSAKATASPATGGQRRSKTPGRADYLTPGLAVKSGGGGMLPATAAAGARSLSRLALASGPAASPRVGPASGGGTTAAPQLRSRSRTAPDSKRLQPRQPEPALVVLGPQQQDEEHEEQRVELPFGVPGAAAGQQWHVSPVVVSLATRDEGANAEPQPSAGKQPEQQQNPPARRGGSRPKRKA